MAFDSLAYYKKLLVFAFVFSRSLFAAETARIAQGPSNVAVVVGKNVSLSCKPDSTSTFVTWYQIPVHSKGIPSPQIRPINNGYAPFRNFSEYSFGGSVPGEVLSLNYTRLSHAGLYRCSAGGQQATAQIIVLAWEPNCSFTFDRGLLHLSCVVMYNGDWIPSMQWLETMANGTESRTMSESNCSKPFNNVETFNHSTRFHFESIYVFKLNFANRNCVKTNIATNIPDYEYTWKLKNTQIFYGPETVVVHPKKDFYSSSENLNCSSDSYPNSDFKWTEKNIGDVHSGPILSLKNFSFRNEPYVLRCLAVNVLTNITASSEPYNVQIRIDDESTTNDSMEKGTESFYDELHATVIVLIILFPVMLTIFALLMVFRKSKLTRKRSRILPSEAEVETASGQYDHFDDHKIASSPNIGGPESKLDGPDREFEIRADDLFDVSEQKQELLYGC